ncbi:MAG TPA: tryptophan 7-halogenase, partial [Lysobacter sp.]|nr:tryptophan 7-halogenase [Lysobacter sp.]
FGHAYPTVSWYCLLAGMGIFPDAQDLRLPTPKQAQHNLAALDNLIERSAMNYPDHRTLLQDIPVKVPEETLQLYLW